MNTDAVPHERFKEELISGRYLPLTAFEAYLFNAEPLLPQRILGYSVQKRPIYEIELGNGPLKILMWSQMHGNESTTTKAVIDLINFMRSDNALAKELNSQLSLCIIPILNPDGARLFIRENANGADLNRDAQDRKQPESKVLRKAYDQYNPDYCFNLHDQRTIYNVGDTPEPATISFLAPAMDELKSVPEQRALAMDVIFSMYQALQKEIPGKIARYSDAFNPECVGDTFTMCGTPTILFEAGHFPGDYQREQTRKFLFMSLVCALEYIGGKPSKTLQTSKYQSIPDAHKRFYDVLIRNVAEGDSTKDVGINFLEVLENDEVRFIPEVDAEGDLALNFGHETFDLSDPEDLATLQQKSEIWQLIS